MKMKIQIVGRRLFQMSIDIIEAIKRRDAPKRRGKLSNLLRKLNVGQCIVCPPGYPRMPHQTVYHHNKMEAKSGSERRWSAQLDKEKVWRIFRVK